MRAVFRHGPWDGVELEVPALPNQLIFRKLCPSSQELPPKGTIDLGKEFEFDVYTARERRDWSELERTEYHEILADRSDEAAVEVISIHTPNSRTWLDTV